MNNKIHNTPTPQISFEDEDIVSAISNNGTREQGSRRGICGWITSFLKRKFVFSPWIRQLKYIYMLKCRSDGRKVVSPNRNLYLYFV